ncbi:MFS transporter [Sphaerisporangium sp. NPDC051017]|uniref:MFS transporter n=1 Tax=unclassified Sphaerisporangium TaxID=2630420 RepID=UPI0033CB91CD
MATVLSGEGEQNRSATRPLSRNRNYSILWSSQLLSELTVEVIAVAIPLLIMARSGSALEVGLASSVMAAIHMVSVVPAGVLADRMDHRKIMLVCQAGRVVGLVSLAAALIMDVYFFPHVLLVVALEGFFGSVFDPVEHAALPTVVPESQFQTAVARNAARPYVAAMFGPFAAGLLFTLNPAGPFVTQGAMLAISFAALLFLRLPRLTAAAGPGAERKEDEEQQEAEEEGRSARADAADGFRWVLGHGVIRMTLLWITLTNLTFSALVIIVLVRSGEENVAGYEIGLMMTCFGVGGLLGAAVAARLTTALRPAVIVMGFSWVVTAVAAVMAYIPSGLPLGLLFGLAAFLAPAANTTVLTYQMMATPAGMRGRLSGISGLSAGIAGVLGPAAGSAVVSATDGPTAFLVCAGGFAVVALVTVLSPSLRRFPSIEPGASLESPS